MLGNSVVYVNCAILLVMVFIDVLGKINFVGVFFYRSWFLIFEI